MRRLDVSDKQTHICVVDAEGTVIRRDCVASDPEALGKWLKRHCSGPAQVLLAMIAKKPSLVSELLR